MKEFDLEKVVATWRKFHLQRREFLKEDLDELESHLRDQTAHFAGQGMDDEAAFRRAVEALGDLEGGADEYRKVYWGKVRRRHELSHEIAWRLSMMNSYLQIALRHLRKQKLYSFINIFGLTVGITCCLLIGLYVRHEWSYDRFHEKADRIYRVKFDVRKGDVLPPTPEQYAVWGPATVAKPLEADFPEVEHAVRISGRHQILLARGDRSFMEERYFFVDPSFFEAFSFPMADGDATTALAHPRSLVLTESAATRYFGDEHAIGQTLMYSGEAGNFDLTVTGVMEDVPVNSHMEFDMLISMSTFEDAVRARDQAYKFDNWGYVDFFTYVLLRDGVSAGEIEGKLPEFVDRNIGDAYRDVDQTYDLALEPLVEAYHSPAGTLGPIQPGPKGREENLYLFSLIGAVILVIACLNFMNLATARSATRAKEVGIRKTVGALRGGLVGQFLAEATLISLFATAMALLLSMLCLPLFRLLADKEISAASLGNPLVLGALVAGALGIGLAAGSYPALVLSRFRPSSVLKGNFATSRRGAALRKTLVVFQFATAIALIVGTIVVRQQLGYMQGRSLGFQDEQQLLLDFGGDSVVRENIESIKNELASIPGIRGVSATRSVPGGYFPDAGTELEAPEGIREVTLGLFEVDTDFLPQIGATAVAGRLFSGEISSDANQALLLNEAAVQELGYADPAEAVGKKFQQWGREGLIIGVVKDFNYESLHHEIRPLSFRVSPWVGQLVLHVSTEDVAGVIDAVRESWSTLAPHRPFLFSFLDQNFDALYRSEDRFAALFGTFAALAIFVACLGLFGLAAFSAQQRTKEIGVRKVMGATVGSVTGLLSKEFLKLVLVGFVLAVPAAYFAMSRWLEGFAYRIELGWEIFFLAGIITLIVALSTVSYQAVKAAMSDPVVSLHYE